MQTNLTWVLALAAALLALPVAPDAAATSSPVPPECEASDLSAADQARCDVIARTPDICRRQGLSEDTQRWCDQSGFAGDADPVCRSSKLRAVGHYYPCLLRADADGPGATAATCGSCKPSSAPSGSARAASSWTAWNGRRTACGAHAQAVLNGDVSPPPCATVTADGAQVICWLTNPVDLVDPDIPTVSSVSLESLLSQLNGTAQDQCAPCSNVTANTVLWLQAWGGEGGDAAPGGGPGFAQTVTTTT